MRKISNKLLLFFSLSIFLTTGCVRINPAIRSLAAVNIQDLRDEEKNIAEMNVLLDRDEAFEKILSLAEQKNLLIYQKDLQQGYIVLMGFPEQVDTTRVGVFLREDNGGTLVSLRSLSSSALKKAEKYLFGELPASK